ncbi:hypothetical protein [Rhodophyticola sp.]|jgi:hypothetical protein|uniref:hypothetical protein n=1 Tax=Rhodophyticola sp. TaxID=2680032 RepID=UPI003D2C4742
MTNNNAIIELKHLAKRYAHANRLPKHEALNEIAKLLDFPHWAGLAVKEKQGWVPSAEQLATVRDFVKKSHPSSGENAGGIETLMLRHLGEPIRQGRIEGHAYRVFESFGDVLMEGNGWRILIGEAQFSQPIVEVEKSHSSRPPVYERNFLHEALAIADEEATKMRARIASDWPRRATKPDVNGEIVHPIHGDRAAKWYCLHCESKIGGVQLAESLWHCPGCGASPIDIFSSPFWLGERADEPKPVEWSKTQKRPEPRIDVVDSRPRLALSNENIVLLLRAALVEDASTPGERLGALLAEISVDDDNDAWITLDEDLWPEGKELEEAIAVANMLGVELELEGTCMTAPFAWPDLGHMTSSTREYVQALLDAYKEHGSVDREGTSD